MPAKKKWTTNMRLRAIEFRRRGVLSVKQIAAKLGVSKQTIYNNMRHLEVWKRYADGRGGARPGAGGRRKKNRRES